MTVKTDKKNQHYIPKFYLRNFSYNNNQKQIGVFNLAREFYHQTAKLKTQGSKSYFYGYDGKIEDALGKIESRISPIIKNIVDADTLPDKNSSAHFTLLTFIVLTHLRSPIALQSIQGMDKEMSRRIEQLSPEIDKEKYIPKMSHQEQVAFALSMVKDIIPILIDLDFKIISNKSTRPFISSDFPIVRYNQFLEQHNWERGTTGYGTVGLQVFLPLNSNKMLIIYDSGVYKVGFKKRNILELHQDREIDDLNVLQFLNSFETIFFDQHANEEYIRRIHEKSKNFYRAHREHSKLLYAHKLGSRYLIDESKKEKNLILTGTTECNTDLKISGVKIHSKGKKTELGNSAVIMRPKVKSIYQAYRPR